jgi:hypothetical protein
MIKGLIPVLSLLLGLQPALASETPEDYAVQAQLQLSGEGPWYRLELPMSLQLAAQYGDLRDLRVFNAAGQMQAYALQSGRQQYQETRRELDLPRFPLYGKAVPLAQTDGRLRIRMDAAGALVEVTAEPGTPAPADQPLRGWLLDASAAQGELERLILDWSAGQEGFQRFSIEASDDLQNWRGWGAGQLARMAFDGAQVEQNEVPLHGRSARYLRLLWEAGEPPAQLNRVRLISLSSHSLPVPMIWTSAMPPVWHGRNEYRWELPVNLPLDRARVELNEVGILAPVVLSGRLESSKPWRQQTHGLLYRLDQQGEERIQNELALHGQPLRYLQLTVDPRGGGLGEAPRLAVGLHATQVIFLARGEGPYRIAIGRAGANSAALPVTTLVPGYREERLAQLGVAQTVIAADASGNQPPHALNADGADESVRPASDNSKRYGLWAVLILGVLLLAGMSLSLLRKPGDQAAGGPEADRQ